MFTMIRLAGTALCLGFVRSLYRKDPNEHTLKPVWHNEKLQYQERAYKALRELRDSIQRIYDRPTQNKGKDYRESIPWDYFITLTILSASICSGLPVKTVRFNINSLYCIPQYPYRFSRYRPDCLNAIKLVAFRTELQYVDAQSLAAFYRSV